MLSLRFAKYARMEGKVENPSVTNRTYGESLLMEGGAQLTERVPLCRVCVPSKNVDGESVDGKVNPQTSRGVGWNCVERTWEWENAILRNQRVAWTPGFRLAKSQ